MQFNKKRCFSVLHEILLTVLSQILLNAIIQNFVREMLTLKDDIDVIFTSTACQGALQSHFFQNFLNDFLFYEIAQKFICNICIITNNNYTFYLYINFNRGRYHSIFSKILVLIVQLKGNSIEIYSHPIQNFDMKY